jgi:HEPN domain-containing protein
MGDTKQALSLLRLASADFKALRGMSDAETFEDAVFGFHAQQAVEKSLKAWLCIHDLACPRTHDLGQLLVLLNEGRVNAAPYSSLVRFTPFAAEARYGDGIMPPDTPLDRSAIVTEVGALLEHVRRQVETLSR